MPDARGFLTRASLTREALTYASVWPAATPAAGARLLPLLSEAVQDATLHAPHRRVGTSSTSPGAVRGVRVGGPLALLATYDGLEHVWALALGAMAYRVGGVALPETLTSGAYRHLYECAPVLRATGWPAGCGAVCGTDTLVSGQQQVRRATYVADKQVSAWEALSAMIAGLTFDAGPGAVTLALDLVAHSLDRASATNPDLDGADDAPTFPVAFQDLELRINHVSASTALDASDAVDVTRATVALDNALAVQSDVASGLYVREPRRRGTPTVRGAFTLPDHETDQFMVWAAAQTDLMASFTFTGPQIASTGYAYSLTLWLPRVRLDAAPVPTSGAESVAPSVQWTAYAPDVTCAGFPATWLAGPLVVELQTDSNVHPLL